MTYTQLCETPPTHSSLAIIWCCYVTYRETWWGKGENIIINIMLYSVNTWICRKKLDVYFSFMWVVSEWWRYVVIIQIFLVLCLFSCINLLLSLFCLMISCFQVFTEKVCCANKVWHSHLNFLFETVFNLQLVVVKSHFTNKLFFILTIIPQPLPHPPLTARLLEMAWLPTIATLRPSLKIWETPNV